MTGRLTDRNCNHNDGHSEKDLSFSENADDCRLIAGDFHPRKTNRPRFCYADTHNTFLKHAFQPRRGTVFSHRNPSCRLIALSNSGVRHTGFRDFITSTRTHSLHLIFTDLLCQHWHGKVCDVLHQIEFAAHHPCQANLGWDGSRVALPILDSALRRFDYTFYCTIYD